MDFKSLRSIISLFYPDELLSCANSSLQDSFQGAILGSAIGDALGRVTEFMATPEAIEKKYGSKLASFDQLKTSDWCSQKFVPYTDDTLFAIIVLEECIKQRLERRDVSLTLMILADRFIKLFGAHNHITDPLNYLRAHGNMDAFNAIAYHNRSWYKDTAHAIDPSDYPQHKWWLRNPHEDEIFDPIVSREAGCGSVVRAWPIGLVFSDNLTMVKKLAEDQSKISHRHPMARSSCVAIAVGTAQVVQAILTPSEIVEQMILAARNFDAVEVLYKPLSKDGVSNEMGLEEIRSLIAGDRILTSDMMTYAQRMAIEGAPPEEVLGVHNLKGNNLRSTEGFLLGWAADEAVAAAIYIFLRHPDNLHTALIEAVNIPGDSDSIGCLAGALVGAHIGWKKAAAQFKENNFKNYKRLENYYMLTNLAKVAARCQESQSDNKLKKCLKSPPPQKRK